MILTQEFIHVWTFEEAYASGKTAFRIKVDLVANPFKGALGEAWAKGWQSMAAVDTFTAKRIDYSALEDNDRGKSRNRFKNNSR